jgi:hypothetical protein
MDETFPIELIIFLVAGAGFLVTLAAMVIYYYVAQQSKRRGQRPEAVIQADLEALAEKGRSYRQLGEVVQKAAARTLERLNTTLASVEDKLASTETTKLPGEAPSSPQKRQSASDPPPPESALPPLPASPQRVLERPVTGMPGRTLDPLNLTDNIDRIVQQKLRERPDLAGRRVRLATGRDGELRIYVDSDVFEAVSDITDLTVREIIRDAIREWEGI